MRTKTRTHVVAVLLLSLVCYAPATVGARQKDAKFVAQVKNAVARIGTGADARVELKLRDKTRLKGYVSGADEEGFSVVDDKTGAARQIPYPQVRQMKGHNLTTGDKILLGFVVFLIITTVIGMVLEGA